MRMVTHRSHPRTIGGSDSVRVLDCVRSAIDRCLCRYDVKDVEDELGAMGRNLPRASVSRAMRRLLRKKEILVAEPGKGSRATVYKKPGT